MNSATDPLLEALAFVHPFGLRISDLHDNLETLESSPPSIRTFYRARDELLENEYIERVDDADADLFRITEKGLGYLEGEIQKLDLDFAE